MSALDILNLALGCTVTGDAGCANHEIVDWMRRSPLDGKEGGGRERRRRGWWLTTMGVETLLNTQVLYPQPPSLTNLTRPATHAQTYMARTDGSHRCSKQDVPLILTFGRGRGFTKQHPLLPMRMYGLTNPVSCVDAMIPISSSISTLLCVPDKKACDHKADISRLEVLQERAPLEGKSRCGVGGVIVSSHGCFLQRMAEICER